MHGVEAFGLFLRQSEQPHGTDLESLVFDAVNDFPRKMPFDGIRPMIANVRSVIRRS